ncbi:hypothetical protein Bca52824_003290 [Brassica carinata]|uniref:MSP domain-containing protein n=1 Tax=Brassica carinata TaxID=52824 RepID=A0A8X8BEM0_BRACI|nr:hypothetical protein Bca52824_003290 [Brassica carinata]
MSNKLLDIEPLDLQFHFELKKQMSCTLYLTNKTDNYVAFKVKTTNLKNYTVRPNTGVVLPRSSSEVLVNMQAQKEAPADMQCKDKFLLQCVVATPGVTAKEVTREMFSKEAGNRLEETKLRVVYVGHPALPVRKGSVPRASVSDNGNASARALITRLTEEKNSAVQLNKKLQQELHEEVDHQGCHLESPNPSTANLRRLWRKITLSVTPVVSQCSGTNAALQLSTRNQVLKPQSRNRGTTPVHTLPIHASPNHKPSIQHHPDHEVSDHNIPTPNSPFTPKDTPIHPPKTIKTSAFGHIDAKDHPIARNSPHYIPRQRNIERISRPFPSLPPPKSTPQSIHLRRRIFPLSPSFHPQPSPNKSSDGLPGFIGHASAVNAFSQTATSSPFSVANSSLPNLKDQPAEENEVCELSDSSPARERPKHIPSVEENILAKELYRSESVPALDLICPLNQSLWDRFETVLSNANYAFHITPSKFDFSNNFLLQLAKPSQWTTTYHMEILMYMLAARHSRLLEEQKLAFITPHLTSGIQAISKNFMKSRKRETFQWDEKVTEIVLQPRKKWMEDVITVYTLMIWADKHWVGLAINLDLGLVEILDPIPNLYSEKAVAKFMAPVLKSIPYLVKKVANYELTQFRGLEAFHMHRIPDLYINERTGDCGPVSVKFLEMHAHGDPEPNMANITDTQVDDFRKQFVLDIYKTIVLPAYYGRGRRTVHGVPNRCWCGKGLDMWVSETKENPYRRFYRCKIALQLTKAIDESTSLMKAQIDAKVKTHTNSKWSINQTAAAMAMIGAMTYLYWKLL